MQMKITRRAWPYQAADKVGVGTARPPNPKPETRNPPPPPHSGRAVLPRRPNIAFAPKPVAVTMQ